MVIFILVLKGCKRRSKIALILTLTLIWRLYAGSYRHRVGIQKDVYAMHPSFFPLSKPVFLLRGFRFPFRHVESRWSPYRCRVLHEVYESSEVVLLVLNAHMCSIDMAQRTLPTPSALGQLPEWRERCIRAVWIGAAHQSR